MAPIDGRTKFSNESLQACLDKGMTQVQIAKFLDVGKAAVSKRVKKLRQAAVNEVKDKIAEIEDALQPLVKGDLAAIASDPGKSLHQVVVIYLNLLRKLVKKEASATAEQWPAILKQVLAVGDSLAKHLVDAIRLTELLRYRQNIERIEKVIMEILSELPKEHRRKCLKKLNRRAVTQHVGRIAK
jgi:predicted transcriptional regulator